MVAETTKTRNPKPAPIPYVPTVEVVDFAGGAYSVQSQTDPREFYFTTVGRPGLSPSCNCKAGEYGFLGCKSQGVCKHVLAAQIVDGALENMVAEQRAREAAAVARQQAASKPVAFTPAPDYFAECYS